MDDLLRRLGQRIRELRSRNAWSQEEFADICRVSAARKTSASEASCY
jgi:transcriptional regulator with XRE-family HTH domain